MRDANGLVYLRARYYAPQDGRFLSRDAWGGDYNRPLSLNRWNYVEGNPVNFVDPSGHFSAVHDYGTQLGELQAYSFWQPSSIILQTTLNLLPKTTQYHKLVIEKAGVNACGLVAAASASGEPFLDALYKLVDEAGGDYDGARGIQPTPFVAAMRKAFPHWVITKHDRWTLGDMFRSLQGGKKVIVDIKVMSGLEVPSPGNGIGNDYAHFAQVLGIDVMKEEIYIENTLRGSAYWTISLRTFWGAWTFPETTAGIIPAEVIPEAVNRWAVTMQ